jgi:hypothetical protein
MEATGSVIALVTLHVPRQYCQCGGNGSRSPLLTFQHSLGPAGPLINDQDKDARSVLSTV